jgi:hypothetical protein
MYLGELTQVIGIIIFVVVVMASFLLSVSFLGAKKKDFKMESGIPPSAESPKVKNEEEQKIEELKDRAKSYSPHRLIPKDQLEKSKREMRTLLLEKELVSGALTRLYEAEASGEISKEEREIIGAKYRQELKQLDSKIVGIDAFIEVGDLETLRDQLLLLVSEKIDAIERRIDRMKLSASPMIREIMEKNSQNVVTVPVVSEKNEKLKVPDISDLLTPSIAEPPKGIPSGAVAPARIAEPVVGSSKNQRNQSRQRNPSSDVQVEELQKELLEALDRLEKLDVET